MADGESNHKKFWTIGASIASFAAGIVGAAFVLGSARQKTNDVIAWREVVAPRIERMDAQGTLSFSHFKTQYDKVQDNQFRQLEELSRARYAMEKKLEHMDEAERAIAGFDVRLKRMEDEFSHFDVLEVEHRRLTKDFEQLKDEQRRKP